MEHHSLLFHLFISIPKKSKHTWSQDLVMTRELVLHVLMSFSNLYSYKIKINKVGKNKWMFLKCAWKLWKLSWEQEWFFFEFPQRQCIPGKSTNSWGTENCHYRKNKSHTKIGVCKNVWQLCQMSIGLLAMK